MSFPHGYRISKKSVKSKNDRNSKKLDVKPFLKIPVIDFV